MFTRPGKKNWEEIELLMEVLPAKPPTTDGDRLATSPEMSSRIVNQKRWT
jgi:hypothetical protein